MNKIWGEKFYPQFFAQGYDAGYYYPSTKNLYPAGIREHKAWNDGYAAGKKERAEYDRETSKPTTTWWRRVCAFVRQWTGGYDV